MADREKNGEQGNSRHRREGSFEEVNSHPNGGQSEKMSEMTLAALRNMQDQQKQRRRGRGVSKGTTSIIHDNTSASYGWLLPGWLAEERTVESGRVYRYYYDPDGQIYRTRQEVLNAWDALGVVVLDI